MFCDKCGSKVNDGDIYCPNCNNKIVTESQESNTPQEIATKPNPGKKKFVVCGVVIVIVLGIVSFFNSSIGKCFIANFFEKNQLYNSAYNVVYNISGERGEAQREYYKLLIEVNDFIEGTAEVYKGPDTENTGTKVGDVEYSEDEYGRKLNTQNYTICTLNDVSEIKDSADIVSDHDYLLLNGQKERLQEIESCINKYDDEKSIADKFYQRLYDAYDIYYTINKYFRNREDFSPIEMNEKMEWYNTDLSKAKEIYNSYISSDFYGYSELAATINVFTESMQNIVDKYSDSDTVHYNTLPSYEESPYEDADEINIISNNLKLHIAKRCFDIDDI